MFSVVHVKVLIFRKYCSQFPFHGVLPAMKRRGGGFEINQCSGWLCRHLCLYYNAERFSAQLSLRVVACCVG